MPGTAERHLYKAGGGLRNFQCLIFGSDADTDYFAAQLTGAPLLALVVGSKLTLVATGMPLPRVVTCQVTASATAATRTLTLRFHGEDQFGNYVTDDLVTSNTANDVRVGLGDVVFAKVTVIEVIEITAFETGDTLDVGLDVQVAGPQLAPEDVIYGLPLKVAGIADLRAATLINVGAVGAAVDGSALTLVPGVHGVKLPVGLAPDSGDDRVVILTGRTSV